MANEIIKLCEFYKLDPGKLEPTQHEQLMYVYRTISSHTNSADEVLWWLNISEKMLGIKRPNRLYKLYEWFKLENMISGHHYDTNAKKVPTYQPSGSSWYDENR